MEFKEIVKYYELIGSGKNVEAEEFRQSFIPDKLIKFVWLDGTTNDNKKFNTLLNQQIWISSTKNFNDPFEFKGLFLNKEELRNNGYSEDAISMYEKLFTLDDFGVACLSSNNVNYLPMWAYYTNNYQGFCIEYQIINKACIHEVLYEPKRIPIASLIIQLKQSLSEARKIGHFGSTESYKLAKIIMQNLYIKSNTWEHEKEFRIVQPINSSLGENYKLNELGLKINRIIAGIKCTEDNIQKLNKISNQIGCGNIYISKLSETDYSLIEERL